MAAAKFWINKRLAAHICEALECHGGSGYVEESVMPRLYRQAPLNGIWEGSGNVICLDVLRTLEREPVAVEALLAEVRSRTRRRPAARSLRGAIAGATSATAPSAKCGRAGSTIRMAVVLQAALLVRHGPPSIAEAFCASRLDDDWGGTFGTLPTGLALDEIIGYGRISD